MPKFQIHRRVHSQLGYQKGVFKFLRIGKDNFRFVSICIIVIVFDFFYANKKKGVMLNQLKIKLDII
jgi:hypothetical protein